MNKNDCQTIKLGKGEMHVYDFSDIKLHAYQTNDLIDDEVFILEKNGQAVVIESPCFYDNISELSDYLKDLNTVGMLVAYHGGGGSFAVDLPKYATANSIEYNLHGGGYDLIQNFARNFGDNFDVSIHKVENIIEAGEVVIGGIRFIIEPTAEAFDIVIPEINTVYTHMMGHDCHSIVAGETMANAMIEQLEGYLKEGYDLILTSHYTPEDLKDAQTKIEYLQNLKKIAAACDSKESFIAKVEQEYPNYAGQNYLEMTAGFFYQQ
ncbi:MAG: hypothetical protein Q4C83_02025 [Candidatus Saccharibacteria bacterium]|nr:hypothetical protein [Candidatus Saccharibacteria bacterium]